MDVLKRQEGCAVIVVQIGTRKDERIRMQQLVKDIVFVSILSGKVPGSVIHSRSYYIRTISKKKVIVEEQQIVKTVSLYSTYQKVVEMNTEDNNWA